MTVRRFIEEHHDHIALIKPLRPSRFFRTLTEPARAAAKEAFSGLNVSSLLTADQLEFLDRIIYALTETGLVDPKNFCVSPYTDIDSQGNVGVFPKGQAR